jgi:D-glycero-alpha-D-manno-heptose-7-phosphate kinase
MDARTIRASAPLRISFVGGGTDFPHYYERHGGAVLSATIDHAAHVSLTPRADRQVRIRSLDLGHLVEYHLAEGPVYDGVMDLPKAAIARFGTPTGMDVDIASDAPPGSGLGGSSALVTACVGALAMLRERDLSRAEVARLAHAIEREDLGIAGGWQDQYAAAFGGFNLLEFGAAGVGVSPLHLSSDAVATLRSHLLLCYTGAVRTDLGLIDTQIRLYREGREETIVGMKQLQEMAYEMRDAVEKGDVDALGGLLREAFESKKRMNPHIADGTPIERLLEVARGAGAAGGKVCGAGGGGYLLLACRPERQRAVRAALEAHGGEFADFAFRDLGAEATDGERTWRPS